MRDHCKSKVKAMGDRIAGKVRINSAGCLDQCDRGVTLVVYPEQVWYGHVTPADVDEIVASHLAQGKVVERLLID